MNLLRYIKGFRRGKEAHRVELEAMKDSFLSEALEGYDAIDGDHLKRIFRIQKQIKKRAAKNNKIVVSKEDGRGEERISKQKPARTKSNIPWRKLAVAATVFLCLLGGYYFLKDYDWDSLKQPSVLSESQEKTVIIGGENDTENSQPDTLIINMPPEPSLPKTNLIASARTLEDFTDSGEDVVETPQVQLPSAADLQPSANVSALNLADTKLVKGKVTDNAGEPLLGVSVTQKGSKTGTITDSEGKFSLNVTDSKPILLDYIGFEHVELPPDTSKPMMIAMNETKQSLDEVVAIGYATVKKSDLVGSVATVSKEKSTKPEPEIGMKAFKNYLKANVVQPTDSLCKNTKGKVKLRFFINPEGNPYNIQVIKSLCKTSDSEATRLIQSGGKWKYGNEAVEIEVSF
ncbi:MAG: carboxypeptidase-like regulatory domain-containing protein [Candidatus Azobacteroides sp.]|nr:carboxypeptidase-like regulatory domain-containing protein [Candidatus Azobacteroides sp.]